MTQLRRQERPKVAAKIPPLKSAGKQKRPKVAAKNPCLKSAGKAKTGSGSRSGPTSITHLPDDCLYFIFQRLRCKLDQDSFGLTCLRWLQIQNSSRKSLDCSVEFFERSSLSPTIGIHAPLERLLNRFRQLQSLSLFGDKNIPNLLFSPLQPHGSKLHARCYTLTDYGIYLVGIGCPSLTDITLCRCNITNAGLRILSKSCLGLKDVKLIRCKRISDVGIRALSQNCRQLRYVCTSLSAGVTGVGFKGCSKTLTCVDASTCKLEPEGILGIISGGGLKYLNVSFTAYSLGGNFLGAIGSSGFAKCLTVLNFRMCETVNDEAIVAISKGCPLLQEWNLVSCHEVKLSGWESIGSNCFNLKRLYVNRCRNLCDQGLLAIRDGCKHLTILHINDCAQISSAAMEVFKRLRRDVEIIPEVGPLGIVKCENFHR